MLDARLLEEVVAKAFEDPHATGKHHEGFFGRREVDSGTLDAVSVLELVGELVGCLDDCEPLLVRPNLLSEDSQERRRQLLGGLAVSKYVTADCLFDRSNKHEWAFLSLL